MSDAITSSASVAEEMEIGTVCGVVRGDDGELRYKIFNGMHHGKPTYYYTPAPIILHLA